MRVTCLFASGSNHTDILCSKCCAAVKHSERCHACPAVLLLQHTLEQETQTPKIVYILFKLDLMQGLTSGRMFRFDEHHKPCAMKQHADESSSTCAEYYLQHPSASVSPYGCLRQEGLARPHFNLSASYYKQVGKHVPAQNQACAYASCDICCADTCMALPALAFSISWWAMIALHTNTHC